MLIDGADNEGVGRSARGRHGMRDAAIHGEELTAVIRRSLDALR
jgi:hypothetical protein